MMDQIATHLGYLHHEDVSHWGNYQLRGITCHKGLTKTTLGVGITQACIKQFLGASLLRAETEDVSQLRRPHPG